MQEWMRRDIEKVNWEIFMDIFMDIWWKNDVDWIRFQNEDK